MLASLLAALLVSAPVQTVETSPRPEPTVVLVHGAVMDGSGWRGVYDRLRARGLQVRIATLPLTGLADDVAAARAIIDRQVGSVILVGHSYGGAVITAAGANPRVEALVYVAAFMPDQGESVGDLGARFPVAGHPLMVSKEAMIVDPAAFVDDVAADVPTDLTAFLADSQRPTAVSSFVTPLPVAAAWRDKPVYAIVARQDRTISPDLQRFMYGRAGAQISELDASHSVYISRPDDVAQMIGDVATAICACDPANP